MKNKNILKTTLPILMPLALISNAKAAAPGDGITYSEWSTTNCDNGSNGCVTKTQYSHRTVTSWTACDGSHTSKPADGFYQEGKYDPNNCACRATQCTSYGTSWGESWSCDGTACSEYGWWCWRWGYTVSGYYVASYGTWSEATYRASYYTSGYYISSYYCSGYSCTGYSCSGYRVLRCTGYSCSGYGCSGYNASWSTSYGTTYSISGYYAAGYYVSSYGTSYTYTTSSCEYVGTNCWGDPNACTGYSVSGYYVSGYYCSNEVCTDTSCGNTATCYAVPASSTSWSAWSAWSDTAESKTTSKDVKTQTLYSCLMNCTITLNANKGSLGSIASPFVIDLESTLDLSDKIPTRNGATFAGWYTAATGGSSCQGTVCAGNSFTCYAHWDLIDYPITYTLNGGSATNPTTYNVESATFTLANPTRKGYTFTGWTGSNGSAKQTTVSITSGSYGDKAYTANWDINTYSITYNLNGGTNNSSNPTTYNVETNTITLGDPTKKGYTFDGWYSEEEFTNKVTQIAKGSVGDKALFAKWTANKYNVTLNSQGANSVGTTEIIATYDSALPAISILPTKEGYTFKGYYTSPDGQGTKYFNADGSSAKTWDLITDTTLYAYWEAKPINIENVDITVPYSGSDGTTSVTIPTNSFGGSGSYSFTILEGGENFEIIGKRIVSKVNVRSGEYPVKVRVTDTVTGQTADITYTIVIDTNVYWGIDNQWTMHIGNSGMSKTGWLYFGKIEGELNGYDTTSAWGANASSIKKVVIDADIYPESTAYWFYNMNQLTSIENIGRIKAENITSTAAMFKGCSALTSVDLSWLTSTKNTNLAMMFDGCSSLTGITGLTSLDTSKVTSIYEMFRGCSKLTTLDLSSFDTSAVNDEQGFFEMFSGDSNLTTIYASNKFVVNNSIWSSRMFNGCVKLAGSVSTKYDAEHVDGTYARIDQGTQAPGYFRAK